MIGPNISAILSIDPTIQHLFVDLIGPTGLATISMTFAQIYWSLSGAQNRFGFASATILLCRWIIMLPIAAICIYRYTFDLLSVAGAVAIGYAVATCILAYAVFTCDWEQISNDLFDDVDGDLMDYYNDHDDDDEEGGIVDEVSDEDDDSSAPDNDDDIVIDWLGGIRL